MNWALRRQILDILILIAVFLLFGSIIAYPYLSKEPTCTDGTQNGTETGIDCGGLCARACIEETDPLSILWSRAFQVVPGRFNAVAYVENHNRTKAVDKVSYRFRFADANNLYIGKRDGTTFIPPSGNFAIFEPAIDLGHSVPVYTTFEFTQAPVWLQVEQSKIDQLKVLASDIKLENVDKSPKLSTMITNDSLFDIPNVSVVAILYDKDGNAISVSQTYIDKLFGEEKKVATFTWPEPFAGEVVAKEIIPMFNVFSAAVK